MSDKNLHNLFLTNDANKSILNVFEDDVFPGFDGLKFQFDRTLEPKGQKLFCVADQEVDGFGLKKCQVELKHTIMSPFISQKRSPINLSSWVFSKERPKKTPDLVPILQLPNLRQCSSRLERF
jgi:hypothetical protein